MIRYIIIVPAKYQNEANAFAKTLDTRGGEHTFNVALYPIQQDPQTEPSHYWCSIALSDEMLSTIEVKMAQFEGCILRQYEDSDVMAAGRLLEEFGLCRKRGHIASS